MILIAIAIYLYFFTAILAGKDASSYLLKDKNASDPLTLKRISRWHRDGTTIFIFNLIPIIYAFPNLWWSIIVVAILIRISAYDILFNDYADLDVNYIGTTAKSDKIFAKIFGQEGAVTKSICFLVVLIIFLILKIFL